VKNNLTIIKDKGFVEELHAICSRIEKDLQSNLL